MNMKASGIYRVRLKDDPCRTERLATSHWGDLVEVLVNGHWTAFKKDQVDVIDEIVFEQEDTL